MLRSDPKDHRFRRIRLGQLTPYRRIKGLSTGPALLRFALVQVMQEQRQRAHLGGMILRRNLLTTNKR